jgi:outer membrane protein insertion porin family
MLKHMSKMRMIMKTGLLIGCSLFALAEPAMAQTRPAPATAPAAAPQTKVIQSINVTGSQRIEADTVRSYIKLRPGTAYSVETLDDAVRDLYETELFAEAAIRDDNGNLTIEVRENPVVNRIILEGNKRLKEEKIRPEIKMSPRQIFTRSKVRADVARIIELYQRQGRYAATIEPKMVMLDQNRVDIVFEINEGAKSKVRQINIIGNEKFKDSKLISEMATRPSKFYTFFSSKDGYDPDKMAYDQSKLRQFYLTQGYADIRVVSAVAELTPDKKDFIITYVLEEGDRYKFGDVSVDSELRDFKPSAALLVTKKDNWYNAKQVEDTVEGLTESAGLFGYAFAEIEPDFTRDKDTKTMAVTYKIADAPRVYVERIDINGNTQTQDKVIRREFRLAEGDAFNSFAVKRSSDRIQSLGYFQEKLEIEQKPGSAPDKIVLEANVEEKSTGELQLSAGFSSLERFILNFSIRQRNFRGKGQELRAGVNYSSYSKSIDIGFTEPYFLDRNIAVGADIFRRDYSSFNFGQNDRNTNYKQVSTGFQLRSGLSVTEYLTFAARYGLTYDDVTLPGQYLVNGVCDPLIAGRYLCEAQGKRTTSTLGYTLFYDNLNNRQRPTKGQRISLSQDFAGLGGSVKYVRSVFEAKEYKKILGGFVLSAGIEAGYMHPFGKSKTDAQGDAIDRVRLTDRFYMGEPDFPGFDIRGLGPRVLRRQIDATGQIVTDRKQLFADDSLGGRAKYLGRLEMEIPLGSGARELGLRPSVFAVFGSVFGVKDPKVTRLSAFPVDANGIPQSLLTPILSSTGARQCIDNTVGTLSNEPTGGCVTGNSLYASSTPPFDEIFVGDTWKPRLSVGFGVNWRSPFGPFRIDVAKALITREGDDPKLFTFNVGTEF